MMDYKDNFSISEVYQTFGDAEYGTGNRGFSIVQKGKRKIIDKNFEKVHLFVQHLLECGSIYSACQFSEIDTATGLYYINSLNKEAIKRGLPEIYNIDHKSKDSNRKLCAKQVSYIKYLCSKYSEKRVAKMYNVNQSTIHLIKVGMTWKNIPPAIVNHNPIKIINQYKIKGA